MVDSFEAVLYASELLADSMVSSSILICSKMSSLSDHRSEGRRSTNLAGNKLVDEVARGDESSVTVG